jgi:3-oxoacyl-[acyl-carrier protein] reductase
VRKSDKKIIIINGTADAIAIAGIKKFGQSDVHVFIWDNDEQTGNVVVASLKAQKYVVEFQKTDSTKLEEIEKRAKTIFDKYSRIDILINNGSSTFEQSNIDWPTQIEKSLSGVMNGIKAVSPYMLMANFGRIINTTALLGLYGSVNQANYTSIKNGVIGISKIWTLELSKHNITVNTVAPGYVDCDYISKNTAMVVKSIKEKIPARKIGTAEDVANAYFFLASEDASYITGAVLNIDGGYSV